jgi:hypothetical protein
MKNRNRITAFMPSVQGYRHFTGVLAYGMIFTIKSNDDISACDFAYRQVYL